jgi:outer membrane protein
MKTYHFKVLSLAALLLAPGSLRLVHAQDAAAPDITETVTAPAVLPPLPVVPPATPSLADKRSEAAQEAPVLSFSEAIALTLQNNPQRAAARAAAAAAAARVGTAKSAGGLQVGLSGDATYNKNFGGGSGGSSGGTTDGGFTFGSNQNSLRESVGVTAQLPVYNGGRVKAGTRAAQATARAQAAQTLQVEQDLVLSAATTYLAIVRNEQLVGVAESNLAVSQERLRVARVRFEAGAAARLDVLRAVTTLADAEQRRVVAGNDVAQAKATLNTLMGREPETPLRVVDINTFPTPAADQPATAKYPDVSEKSSTELRAIAENSSPTLAAGREQVKAAEANVDVAKAQKKPSLGLNLSAFLNNPATALGRFAASLGLGIAKSLFDSGRNKSLIAEARSNLEQVRQGLEGERLTIFNQLEQSLLTADAAEHRLTSTDTAVVSAQEAVRSAQLGYEAGALTAVDVSDAQAALVAAQTEAVNARFDLALARARLAAAAGVLTPEWQAAYEAALRDELARLKPTK